MKRGMLAEPGTGTRRGANGGGHRAARARPRSRGSEVDLRADERADEMTARVAVEVHRVVEPLPEEGRGEADAAAEPPVHAGRDGGRPARVARRRREAVVEDRVV